jgi:hypothetical protein
MNKKKIDRQKAILSLRKEAEERVIKDEVMRFRLESETLQKLLELSKKTKKPAGTLVREWVIEKLEQLQGEQESPEGMAITIIATSLAERGILKADQVSKIQKLLTSHVD